MNTDTGKAYLGLAAVAAALDRGEHLVPVSDRAGAKIVLARQALARQLKQKRRARVRDRMAKVSRRNNRGGSR
jgi:hypothetical protein